MRLLTVFAVLATSLAGAAAAFVPNVAKDADAAPKVRQLRVKLAKVLEHASGLSPAISNEARQVDDHAASALRGSGAGDELGLEKVLGEFAIFSKHLTGRAEEIKREASSSLPEGALQKAALLVPGLESKVRKVVEHLKADKGKQSPAHATVIATMEQALAPVAGQNAFDRAVVLHNSLKSAHDFLSKRSDELAADRERLSEEIEEEQTFVLYMMLKQRRKLPLKSQLVLLKRHQFKDSRYAQQLLKKHATSPSLDAQLMAMLPQALAQKLANKVAHGHGGSLAAAGSNGRVEIVSSRMKNAVQTMAAGLAKAKTQLQQIVGGSSVTASEKKQAKEIMEGLDAVLKKVSSTHDLKSQMEAMDDMQNKLKTWMLNAASHN